MLDTLGLRNRLLILTRLLCWHIRAARSPTSAIVTAASAERTSFGCAAVTMIRTFFGDAMVNRAMRRPQPLARRLRRGAGPAVATWEAQ